MGDIVVNGIKIHYEATGDGPKKVIFLHGLMLSCHIWDEVMKLMPSDCQCFALDTRGFGDSEKPPEGYTLATLADDVSSFMRAMSIDKATIVGHSISGPLAIHFGANHPDQVDNVVLVATFGRMSTMFGGGREGMQELMKAFGTPPDEMSRETMESLAKFMVYDTENMPPRLTDALLEYAVKADRNAIMQTAMSPTSADFETEITKIGSPVLIFRGAGDTLFPAEEADFFTEAVSHGKLVVMDKSGHLPMVEQPNEFVSALTIFLASP